jgi:hypothetical protein
MFTEGPRAARRRRGVITTAVALTAAGALASPAVAAVADPHVLAAIPDASALELSGYPPNAKLTIEALRGPVVIGTATGTTSAGDGTAKNPGGDLAVNPDVCWQGSSPQLLPGDTIRVTGAGTDTMTIANVEATSFEQDLSGDILVHGFATGAGGAPLDAATFSASVQARLTTTGALFDFNGRNTLRAGATKTDGTIAYDAPTLNEPAPTTWTARFHLTTQADVDRALANKNVEGVLLVGLSELTIGRTPVGAPGAGCPPVQKNSVTSFGGRTAVNVANAATPMGISGAAQPDVTNVAVTLTDHNGKSVAYAGVAPSGGTWTTAGMGVGGLADGTLTATPTMTSTSIGTFTGATSTILKDTVAPPAPVSSVPAGTYPGPKTVAGRRRRDRHRPLHARGHDTVGGLADVHVGNRGHRHDDDQRGRRRQGRQRERGVVVRVHHLAARADTAGGWGPASGAPGGREHDHAGREAGAAPRRGDAAQARAGREGRDRQGRLGHTRDRRGPAAQRPAGQHAAPGRQPRRVAAHLPRARRQGHRARAAQHGPHRAGRRPVRRDPAGDGDPAAARRALRPAGGRRRDAPGPQGRRQPYVHRRLDRRRRCEPGARERRARFTFRGRGRL